MPASVSVGEVTCRAEESSEVDKLRCWASLVALLLTDSVTKATLLHNLS